MYEPSRHVATFFIAGFQHWDGALLLSELRAGDRLEVVPEPDNPHDPNCLAICLGQRKIGYVPKAHNSLPALLMYYGHRVFELRVLQVDPEADPWEQVRVGLYVIDAR